FYQHLRLGQTFGGVVVESDQAPRRLVGTIERIEDVARDRRVRDGGGGHVGDGEEAHRRGRHPGKTAHRTRSTPHGTQGGYPAAGRGHGGGEVFAVAPKLVGGFLHTSASSPFGNQVSGQVWPLHRRIRAAPPFPVDDLFQRTRSPVE